MRKIEEKKLDSNYIRLKEYVGKTIPNRKRLSEILNVTYMKSSNQKKYQDNVWRQYFDFEVVPNKREIRILSVYDKKKNREESVEFKPKRSNYKYYIYYILLDKLTHENHEVSGSISKFIRELDAFNENYFKYLYKHNELADKVGVDVKIIDNIYKKIKTKMRGPIESVFSDLENNEKIIKSEEMGVIYNKDGSKKYRVATNEEEVIINDIVSQLLNKYNCKNESETMKYNLADKYYTEKKEMLKENLFIDNVYKNYSTLGLTKSKYKKPYDNTEDKNMLNYNLGKALKKKYLSDYKKSINGFKTIEESDVFVFNEIIDFLLLGYEIGWNNNQSDETDKISEVTENYCAYNYYIRKAS